MLTGTRMDEHKLTLESGSTTAFIQLLKVEKLNYINLLNGVIVVVAAS
jgi:hypothetical protein